jgi:alanine racemase
MNLSELQYIIKAELRGSESERIVDIPCTDTRKISNPSRSVFIALPGSGRDGHSFIKDAYNKGIRCFVVSAAPHLSDFQDASFLLVQNTLTALQSWSKSHRKKIVYPVLAISGSHGKTIVKEWLNYVLHEHLKVSRSPGSYNSQIGVPLSILGLPLQADLGIIEAGISQPGEMIRLQEMISPVIGLFTNIGSIHSSNFLNSDTQLSELLTLFRFSEVCICNYLYRNHLKAISENNSIVFCWSEVNDSADVYIHTKRTINEGMFIEYQYRGKKYSFILPYKDEASQENCFHVLACALYLKLSPEYIAERLGSLPSLSMRMQTLNGINNCILLNDSYTADLSSLHAALDSFHEISCTQKTLILSDLSKVDNEEIYIEAAGLINNSGAQKVILIGSFIGKYKHLFHPATILYPNTDSFLKEFSFESFSNEAILIKGRRSFGFERIAARLELKGHETVMEIRSDSVLYNLNFYRKLVGPKTRLMAMVKAFSYGTGGVEMARLLEFAGVDYLAVAYADEGIELRKHGITVPIMVMSPEEQTLSNIRIFGLEPEIYSQRSLNQLIENRDREGVSVTEPIRIHIKIDTGMHRLGFMPEEVPFIIQKLNNAGGIQVISVFSHLAASENSDFDDFTGKQIELFTNAADTLEKSLGYPVMRHILNSAGISRFPEARFDMVRLGIGLYGVGYNAIEQGNLRQVCSWKTRISMIKNLKSGETVGYGRKGVLKRDSRIATIPVGYADGFHRNMGNGRGKVEANGVLCPTIGNICMDMCMIDVTGLDVSEGDNVLLFGGKVSIQEFAVWNDTIGYEVLTGVSPRVKRVYVKE